MYACDDRCYDYGNGHIYKNIHCVHSLQQLGHQETSEDFHPATLYYPPAEQPMVDDTSNQSKHSIYNIKIYKFYQQNTNTSDNNLHLRTAHTLLDELRTLITTD